MEMQEARPGTVDDQTPDIAIPAFADPEQGLLSAGRMLGWNQAKPGSHITRLTELAAIREGDTVSISIYPQPGQDSEAIAREVMRQLKRRESERRADLHDGVDY